MPHTRPNFVNFPMLAAKYVAAFIFTAIFFSSDVLAQLPETSGSPQFRVGERLMYVLSTERYPNAGFGEMSVVSRGRLGTRDVFELAAKFKTVDLFSATGFLADESFTTFVATDTGMPLYVKRANNAVGLPRERVESYLETPANGFDVLSLIYRLRGSFGGGSSVLLDNGRSFAITILPAGIESVTTDAGTFETTVLTVQSEYLKEIGVSDLRINIDNGPNRLPVLIRAKMQPGEIKATLASVQVNSPDPVTPLPTPAATPQPVPTPIGTPTPEVYVENQPLSDELPFDLGERLEYRVTYGVQRAGKVIFDVKERKQFNGIDSLLLTATVTESNPPSTAFLTGDRISAQVDPLTLLPRQTEIAFRGPLAAFSQTAIFDERTSSVSFGGANRADIPFGTHSILSLLYAMRSFKLNPTTDATNPVNDTRVSVFWSNQAYVFVLRPTSAEHITLDGKKVPVIIANITTGDSQLDQLQPKVWLTGDAVRVPVKFTLGQYQFDLESSSIIPPK